MRFSRLRFFIAFFVILTFTSQSFALVSLPCAEMSHSTEDSAPSMMHAAMDMDHSAHSQHLKSMNSADASAKSSAIDDCCGDNGCIQSDCIFTALALINTESLSFEHRFQVMNSGSMTSYHLLAPTSLFRPPIAR